MHMAQGFRMKVIVCDKKKSHSIDKVMFKINFKDEVTFMSDVLLKKFLRKTI